MLRVKSIQLRNWQRVREAEVTFPASGLVVVLGNNGAGKTALGEALYRGLLGLDGRFSELGHYSLNEAGDTYLKIDAQLHSKPLVVELGYRCPEMSKTASSLRYRWNGIITERPHLRQTREELAALIGIAPEVVPWTLFLDGERLKFNRLSQAEALNLLMQAMNQAPWHVYHAAALAKASKISAEAQTCIRLKEQAQAAALSAEAAVKTAEIEHRRAEDELRISRERFAGQQQNLQTAVAAAEATLLAASTEEKQWQRRIKEAQDADAAAYGALELERKRLEGECGPVRQFTSKWKDACSRLEADLRHARTHLSSLQSGVNCPTCKRPISKPDPAAIEESEAKITQLREKLDAAQGHAREGQACIAELEGLLAEVQTQQSNLHSKGVAQFATRLETAQTARERAQQQLRAAEASRRALPEPSDAAVTRAQTLLLERKRLLTGWQEKLQVCTASQQTAEREQRLAAYWVKGFSPEGIPNLTLRRTVEPLNQAAKLLSEMLSGGRMQVQFSADAERADGTLKPRLTTTVLNRSGATRIGGNSKGEASLANIIIAETQTHVGRMLQRAGFRWYDEPLNAQDQATRQNVYAYLRRQAQETGTLTFVVDHHADVLSFADHILRAERDADGYTVYAWQN